MIADYKERKVFVHRFFSVGAKKYFEGRDVTTGETIIDQAIYLNQTVTSKGDGDKSSQHKAELSTIVFHDIINEKDLTMKSGTKEYQSFIKKNKLSEDAIAKCLKGEQKTHKGYAIYYKR